MCYFMVEYQRRADVAEWQTQQTQNLPVVTSCGFNSHHPHLTYRPENSVKMCVKPHIYAVFSCFNVVYIKNIFIYIKYIFI